MRESRYYLLDGKAYIKESLLIEQYEKIYLKDVLISSFDSPSPTVIVGAGVKAGSKFLQVANKLVSGADTKIGKAMPAAKNVEMISEGAVKSTTDLMKDVSVINGKFFVNKNTLNEIGRIESAGVDFGKLKKVVDVTRPSTEGGVSQIVKYSDSSGTRFIIHEVTDASGRILHRDFDAVRIQSGQMINALK